MSKSDLGKHPNIVGSVPIIITIKYNKCIYFYVCKHVYMCLCICVDIYIIIQSEFSPARPEVTSVVCSEPWTQLRVILESPCSFHQLILRTFSARIILSCHFTSLSPLSPLYHLFRAHSPPPESTEWQHWCLNLPVFLSRGSLHSWPEEVWRKWVKKGSAVWKGGIPFLVAVAFIFLKITTKFILLCSLVVSWQCLLCLSFTSPTNGIETLPPASFLRLPRRQSKRLVNRGHYLPPRRKAPHRQITRLPWLAKGAFFVSRSNREKLTRVNFPWVCWSWCQRELAAGCSCLFRWKVRRWGAERRKTGTRDLHMRFCSWSKAFLLVWRKL